MSDTTVHAINVYFSGERREMLVILCGCAAALALAGALYAVARDGFSRGFGVLVLISAVLLGSTAASLLRRDTAHHAQLMNTVSSGQVQQATEALAAESMRINTVIRKYPLYRHVALGVLVLALVCVVATRNDIVGGVAAGLLLLAAAQLVVDHYSERRARGYAAELAALAPPALRP